MRVEIINFKLGVIEMLEDLKWVEDLKKELQTQTRVRKKNERKIKELQDIIEVRDRRIKVLETQIHLLTNNNRW